MVEPATADITAEIICFITHVSFFCRHCTYFVTQRNSLVRKQAKCSRSKQNKTLVKLRCPANINFFIMCNLRESCKHVIRKTNSGSGKVFLCCFVSKKQIWACCWRFEDLIVLRLHVFVWHTWCVYWPPDTKDYKTKVSCLILVMFTHQLLV